MKASFAKKIAVACLSAVMAFGVGAGVSGLKTVNAAAQEYDFADINSQYTLNTVLRFTDSETVPEGAVKVPTTVNVDGGVATLLSLTFPNGTVRNVSDSSVALSALGKYSVSYRFVKDNSSSIYFEEFNVNNNFVDDYNGSATEKFEDGAYIGLKTTLTAGSKTTFNKLIDLSNVDDNGRVDLFTFRTSPYVEGTGNTESKVSTVHFNIVDALDPTNYITIVMRPSGNGVGYYFSAKAPKTQTMGLLTSADGAPTADRVVVYIDGVRYLSYLNYAGTWGTGAGSYYNIKFDPKTNRIYHGNTLFADLDLAEGFRSGSEIFKGFSSNEVYISMDADEFTHPEIYNYVTSIGTTSGADLQDCFDAQVIEDKVGPTITVDVEETANASVYGKLNANFTVPSASAIDANGCFGVSYRVYKNYSESNKLFVNVNNDGTFKLTENVVYTIEYTATDSYANKSVKLLKVVPVVVDDIDAQYDYKLADNIQFAYNKFEFVAGQVNTQPVYALANTINNVDKLNVNLVITRNDKVVYEVNYAPSTLDSIPNLDYQPLEVGEYKVTYTVSDNLNSYVSSYNVNSISGNVIAFASKPATFTHYIKSLEYDKPKFNAQTFGSTITENETQVFVKYNNEETWDEIYDTFVVGEYLDGSKVVNPETITFKFTSQGAPDYITAPAKVVDVVKDENLGEDLSFVWGEANMDINKYFEGDFEAIEPEAGSSSQYITYKLNATSGSSTLRYINPLTFNNTNDFFVSMFTDVNYANYSSIAISLIDICDENNKMTVNFDYVNNKDLYLSVNNGERKHSTEKFIDAEISMKYNSVNKRISAFNTTMNHEFVPSTGLFYLEITVGGISGNAGLAVTAVSNQSIDIYTTEDSAVPMINFKSNSGTYPLNTEVTIFAPVVADALTPFLYNADSVSFKVTVNKQVVKSKDGVKLDGTQEPRDYQLVLDKYATYRVDYYVTDVNGNQTSGVNYRIICADQEAPVITLNYGFTEDTIHNVTLGKPFTLDYSVTDNDTDVKDLDVSVIIIHDTTLRPHYDSTPHEISSTAPLTLITDTCTLTIKGMYTVYIYAKDLAGNVSIASYKLNVQL